MDDLELLKNDWKKDSDEFKTYSEKELFVMVKGRSLSLSKTLLIIGVCEIIFWFLFYFFDKGKNEPLFSIQFIIRNFIFLLFFIMLIVSFKKINSSNSSKKLMQGILNLRKIIFLYVVVTFILIIIFGVLNSEQNAQSALKGWIEGYNDVKLEKHENVAKYGVTESTGYFLYGITVFLGIVVLYFGYRKIYGRILKKLRANYNELTKLEENTLQ